MSHSQSAATVASNKDNISTTGITSQIVSVEKMTYDDESSTEKNKVRTHSCPLPPLTATPHLSLPSC